MSQFETLRLGPCRIDIEDLGLEHLRVIYPGDLKYFLDSKITAIPMEEILQLVQTGLST